MKSFTINRVPRHFSESLFFGNGWMGSLLYAGPNGIRLTLDHAHLWELRDSTGDKLLRNWQETRNCGTMDGIEGSARALQRGPSRLKLPSLALDLDGGAVESFRSTLNLEQAEAKVEAVLAREGSRSLRIWLASNEDVLVIEGTRGLSAIPKGWDLHSEGLSLLRNWGYRDANRRREGLFVLLNQEFGERVAVIASLEQSGVLLATISVTHRDDIQATESVLMARLESFYGELESRRARHRQEWRNYWDTSDIRIPDPQLQEALDLERYKLFCNARENGPVVTLQGVWNAHDIMPSWYGDLHNDLNVQASYWSVFKLGQARLATPYVQLYTDAMPHFQARAREFAGVNDGIFVPLMMAPNGRGVPSEWNVWNSLFGPELLVACDVARYYNYTQDEAFLQSRAVPFLRGVANFYEALAETGPDGKARFAMCHSPEIFENQRLLCGTNSTFIVEGIRYVLELLCEWDRVNFGHWKTFLTRLPAPFVDETGYRIFADRQLFASHRHFSHLFPIFPMGQLDRCCPEDDLIIQRSLDTITRFGTPEFAAFSFPYVAILAARAGRGDMSATYLELYQRCFRSPNSFTINGDVYRTGILAASDNSAGASVDAFTLEAGLMFPGAIAEMLVHRSRNTLHLLPALPRDWDEAEVHGLTVEGGYRVSFTVKHGNLDQCEISGDRPSDTLQVAVRGSLKSDGGSVGSGLFF